MGGNYERRRFQISHLHHQTSRRLLYVRQRVHRVQVHQQPRGRDFVREFLDAAREAGLRAGLYFSLIDWRHPDFPHFGDRNHPMRDDPAYSNEGRDFGRYLDYMHAQVRELCSNYGNWTFCGSTFLTANCGGRRGVGHS